MATKSLIFTGTAGALTKVLDLNAQYYGYQDTIDGSPNPESKDEFVRKHIRQLLLSNANEQERRNALSSIPLVNDIT